MGSFLSAIPPLREFFPPTPQAYHFLLNIYRCTPLVSIIQSTGLAKYQAQGKTSIVSRLNLPGRLAWSLAELTGPLNLIFILTTLPRYLALAADPTSFLGTGLPARHETMALLYLAHYANRAVITPCFLAPSISPIHTLVAAAMLLFQFLNSSILACWLVYDVQYHQTTHSRIHTTAPSANSFFSATALAALALFLAGMTGNILAETRLFALRRAAATRKARSEGKPFITYDKVYVVPPPTGLFTHLLYPHYTLEWLEWLGFWALGGVWHMGWGTGLTRHARCSGAFWFVVMEVCVMTPRAVRGVKWYEDRFGRRAVAGRRAVVPYLL